jgi:hypothetical protein
MGSQNELKVSLFDSIKPTSFIEQFFSSKGDIKKKKIGFLDFGKISLNPEKPHVGSVPSQPHVAWTNWGNFFLFYGKKAKIKKKVLFLKLSIYMEFI